MQSYYDISVQSYMKENKMYSVILTYCTVFRQHSLTMFSGVFTIVFVKKKYVYGL